MPLSVVSKDIPVHEFSGHVKEMHRESNHLFEQQYRSIKDADYQHNVAFLPCNYDTKNRFIDIFPCKCTIYPNQFCDNFSQGNIIHFYSHLYKHTHTHT